MLRSRGFVLLTIFGTVCQIITEQIVYTNGWIPMTQNDVYNQIRRGSTVYPVYVTLKPPFNHENNINSLERDIKDAGVDNNKKYKTSLSLNEHSRTAKKIWNQDFNIDVENILGQPSVVITSEASEDSTTKDVSAPAETKNTYEVTENSEKSITSDEKNMTDYLGYEYNPPTDETQNLTSKFYNILSKYNIKANDRLQNYDLSLQRKVQNPAGIVPIPYRYNSLNHLPVDPLLAVFLSNYGFYLPSLYGIKANYNNLYGYLASNNIHNNKPFGLYKIFSDTDSWN